MAILIKTEQYRLTTGDLDHLDHLTPFGILNLFQDIAGNHAEELGIGFQVMLNKNLIWILAKNKYEIIAETLLSKKVIVTTWPKKAGRFDCDREYQIHDEEGRLLVKGTSKWCLYDFVAKRLAPASNIEYPGETLDKNNFEKETFASMAINVDQTKKAATYKVRPSDLDHNQHMNNARYGTVIFDLLRLKDNQRIKSLQLDYNNQTFLDDEFDVFLESKGNEALLYAINKENNIIFKALLEIGELG